LGHCGEEKRGTQSGDKEDDDEVTNSKLKKKSGLMYEFWYIPV
jgi:hypothetical protein